jgi:hypothetical protein
VIQSKFLVMVLIFGLVIMILLSYVFLLRKKESELVIMLAQIYFLIFLRRLAMKMQALFVQFLNLLNKIHNSDSMIPGLVNFCLSRYNNDNEKKIVFVISSLAGWLIRHILFMIFFMILLMKLLEFIEIIIIWVRKNFFESDDEDENENK